MKKIGILVDNLIPTYFNKLLIESLNSIYKTNYIDSIDIFVKDINWPYKKVEYGVFKLHDYQNFSGSTIVTNFELLDYTFNVPHNNKIYLYCHDLPWICGKFSTEKVINFLTSTIDGVYCSSQLISAMMVSFTEKNKISSIDDAIKEVLNG